MAYPGEKEHDEYRKYVIEASESGEKPMTKEEWRKKRKNADSGSAPRTTAMSEY